MSIRLDGLSFPNDKGSNPRIGDGSKTPVGSGFNMAYAVKKLNGDSQSSSYSIEKFVRVDGSNESAVAASENAKEDRDVESSGLYRVSYSKGKRTVRGFDDGIVIEENQVTARYPNGQRKTVRSRYNNIEGTVTDHYNQNGDVYQTDWAYDGKKYRIVYSEPGKNYLNRVTYNNEGQVVSRWTYKDGYLIIELPQKGITQKIKLSDKV